MERLIGIEDARELSYSPPECSPSTVLKGGQGCKRIGKSCMESCLRMKPDRIILARIAW